MLPVICLVFVVSVFLYHVVDFIYFAWLQETRVHSVAQIDANYLKYKSAYGARSRNIVPKIIHQSWKDERIPLQWHSTCAVCKRMYADFKYMLWTDNSSRHFIAANYASFLSAYDTYPHDIQRADAFRYFALYHYGGVYLDLDVGCSRDFRSQLLMYSMLLPLTQPIGVSNDVMIAAPRHPFLKHVISQLPKWNHVYYGTPYLTVFFSTGPAFLSYQAGVYISTKQRSASGRVVPSNLYFLNTELYAGQSADTFFYHVQGNSWHSYDGRLISLIYRNHIFFSCASVLILCGLCVQCYSTKRRQQWHVTRQRRRALTAMDV